MRTKFYQFEKEQGGIIVFIEEWIKHYLISANNSFMLIYLTLFKYFYLIVQNQSNCKLVFSSRK